MNDLRPYQTEVILAFYQAIWQGFKRIILVAPTGAGKTVIASAIIKDVISRHKNVLMFAHRREITSQTSDKLRDLDISHGIIQAGFPTMPLANVQVASIQTLHARAIRTDRIELPPADLVIVDECHRTMARTYRAILDQYPNAIVLGLTATPCRGDGKGLGGVYETMVECPQIPQLIEQGYLVGTKVYAPATPNLQGIDIRQGDYHQRQLEQRMDQSVLIADIVGTWHRLGEGRRTVCFASGVQHSLHIRDRFGESGARCEHIDGDTPKAERDATLARLKSGDIEVVTNAMVLVEGWDQPPVSCCILARPTRQLGLFRQMVGRVLRPYPGKPNAIILDHSRAVFKHGLPEDPVLWTLSEDKTARNAAHEARKSEDFGGPKLIDCSECGALREGGKPCPACGFKPTRSPQSFVCEEGDLALVNGKKPGKADIDPQRWYNELAGYAQERGHKPGFAWHKLKEKLGYPPPRWLTAQPCPPGPEVRSWLKSRAIAWAKAQDKARLDP